VSANSCQSECSYIHVKGGGVRWIKNVGRVCCYQQTTCLGLLPAQARHEHGHLRGVRAHHVIEVATPVTAARQYGLPDIAHRIVQHFFYHRLMTFYDVASDIYRANARHVIDKQSVTLMTSYVVASNIC